MRNLESFLSIDLNVVYRLKSSKTESGKNLFEERVEMYFDKVPLQLSSLQQAVESRNFDAIVDAARSLKSSFGDVGFDTLFWECSRIEEAAQKRISLDYQSRIDILEAYLDQSLSILKQLIKNFAPF